METTSPTWHFCANLSPFSAPSFHVEHFTQALRSSDMRFQLPKRAGLWQTFCSFAALAFSASTGRCRRLGSFSRLDLLVLGITMRPATAVFWSPRYSDGFKHVTAMFVLLAVPMRSQYSMQLALMYNCELINALLKTFGGLYALVDVVASFHVGPKPPERQSMIRY